MDAEQLDFPDASFDVVVAHYVVNTVPHPEAALDEFARVLKPGGEIVIINRVGAEDGRAGACSSNGSSRWPPSSAGARSFPGNDLPIGQRARRTMCV